MKKSIFSLLTILFLSSAFGQCDPVNSIDENFDNWEGDPFSGEMGIGECWSTEPNGGYVYAEQNVTFYAFMSPNLDMYLVSPQTIPSDYNLNFQAGIAGDIADGISLEVGLVNSPDALDSFTSLAEPTNLGPEVQTLEYHFSTNEANQYFAVKVSTSAPHSAAFIDNLVLTPQLSVNDISEIQVSAYPNPVINQLNLTSKSKINEVKIYTLNGQLVKVQKAKSTATQIEFSGLNSEIYIAQISTDKGTETIKVIKK